MWSTFRAKKLTTQERHKYDFLQNMPVRLSLWLIAVKKIEIVALTQTDAQLPVRVTAIGS